MRGTFHLVPAVRGSELVCVFGEPDPAAVRYLRQSGIEPEAATRLARAVARVVAARPLESNGIKRSLDPAVGREATAKTAGGSSVLAMVLRWMVESGALCQVGSPGSDGRPISGWGRSPRAYAPFETVFGQFPRCDRAEADAGLARWYFSAHGPAAVQDWAWWTGLPARRAAEAFQRVRPELDELAVDGWSMPVYMTKDILDERDGRSAGDERPVVRLLPYEDSAIKAYRATRERFFDPRVPEGHHTSFGEVLPTILLDGRVVGTWSSGAGGWSGALEASAGRADRGLSAEPSVVLSSSARRALDQELERVRAAIAAGPAPTPSR